MSTIYIELIGFGLNLFLIPLWCRWHPGGLLAECAHAFLLSSEEYKKIYPNHLVDDSLVFGTCIFVIAFILWPITDLIFILIILFKLFVKMARFIIFGAEKKLPDPEIPKKGYR